MSITENIINQLSNQTLGAVSKPQGFDLNDTTFANLLEKSMKVQSVDNQQGHLIAGMGAPAGFIIEPLNSTEAIQPISQADEKFEIKDVDLGTDYFSNLLKSEPKAHKDLMNFAQKHAANLYKVFNKSLITDIADLAGDIAGIM